MRVVLWCLLGYCAAPSRHEAGEALSLCIVPALLGVVADAERADLHTVEVVAHLSHEGIREACRFDLCGEAVGVALLAERADLHTVEGFLLGLLGRAVEDRLDICAEGVHVLAMLGPPVHDIAVVGGDALLVAFAVADDVLLGQPELRAEIGTEFDSLTVHLAEVCGIIQPVLADLEADMCVVTASLLAACTVPAAMVPREGLVGCDRTVCQLADEGVTADLAIHRLIPVIIIFALAEQTVVGADVAVQHRVIRTRAMHHDALRLDLLPGFVAVVMVKDQFVKVHLSVPPSVH